MMRRAAATCTQLMAEDGSPILGLHLEGPYLNPRRAISESGVYQES